MVRGMFLTLRRVRETLKLGLRSLVFFSSAARLRLVLSVTDRLSQAADPSSIVPVVFASSSGAATRGQVASIVLRQGQIHLNSATPDHDSPSTPLPTTKRKIPDETPTSLKSCFQVVKKIIAQV
ncbi:MAG: hypothetical protein FRX49_13697 [Trebouxia sp. A1-2]|nr:MAG: hypothetical protein FRX49_13697 [Trebouxia sp. A1-2]